MNDRYRSQVYNSILLSFSISIVFLVNNECDTISGEFIFYFCFYGVLYEIN